MKKLLLYAPLLLLSTSTYPTINVTPSTVRVEGSDSDTDQGSNTSDNQGNNDQGNS